MLLRTLVLFFSLSIFSVTIKSAPIAQLTIIVPGNVEGGYDHSAQVLKQLLTEQQLVNQVSIQHVIGAGGTLALNQLISSQQTNEYILLGGRSMIGAAIYNNSNLSILDTQPIAKIIAKPLAIAVAKDSPIGNLSTLLDGLETEAQSIHWVGGSVGAVDYLFLQQVYKKLNLPLEQLSYQPIPGGGSTVAKQLVEKNYTAGISSLDEFKRYQNQGYLRVLATSSKNDGNHNLPNTTASRLQLSLLDWHGVFINKQASDEFKNNIANVFSQLIASTQWQDAVAQNHWQQGYLEGDAFVAFVKQQQNQIQQAFEDINADLGNNNNNDAVTSIIRKPYRIALYIALLAAIAVAGLLFIRHKNQQQLKNLNKSLEKAESEKLAAQKKLEERLTGVAHTINKQFADWQLTQAEKEVGMLLLKGLTFKEIAEVRCKSERTVRQQAGSIYSKSNLANRNDLAAFFLEDLM